MSSSLEGGVEVQAATVQAVDALLPQSQCRRCGFAGCRSYAEAVVGGHADGNRCPPGGEQTARAIAALLGLPLLALDPACGQPGPRRVAVVDERSCIGCTLCLRACPVDAIIGARRLMHSVITDQCTGCELCVQPCPVDCISMADPPRRPADLAMHIAVDGAADGLAGWYKPWSRRQADRARDRFEARLRRRAARSENFMPLTPVNVPVHLPRDAGERERVVLASVTRVRARRKEPLQGAPRQ